MDTTQGFATRDELWRIQEALNDLSATQVNHSERIMRLEQKTPDGSRTRTLWGSNSPFPGVLNSSHHEPPLNTAAEAFRNFDTDTGTSMMSSLNLDAADDPRRAAASRANSVRFDESANNHYGSSRQSIELPARTGSGLGGHALSERSLSHRSDGRASASGFARTNSFGLDSSRLLGSINNSPRVLGNPPPGFFVLGPCPSIIRCWLTETFTNDALLYAAICTGSSSSLVSSSLVDKLDLNDSVFEDGDGRAIRLPVFLTEAKIHSAAMRAASPVPQIPTLSVKFAIDEQRVPDYSIQIILGSDVLRTHNADILFSQDKLMIFDEERNQLSIPLVRPEDDAAYKDLSTVARKRPSFLEAVLPPPISQSGQGHLGVIGQPGRSSGPGTASPPIAQSSGAVSAANSEPGRLDQINQPSTRSSLDYTPSRAAAEDSKSTTESEKSFTAPMSKSGSGVWASSWRSVSSNAVSNDTSSKSPSTYARPSTSRTMKVLRPNKTMANANRTSSSAATATTPTSSNAAEHTGGKASDAGRKSSQNDLADAKPSQAAPPVTKANPVGSGTAFGWLNTGPGRRTATNGS